MNLQFSTYQVESAFVEIENRSIRSKSKSFNKFSFSDFNGYSMRSKGYCSMNLCLETKII